MAQPGDFYSRLVYWLKIVLPLMALAVLSTLFLASRRIDSDDAIPYADVDVEKLAREPRLSSPEYSGVTSDGAAIWVTAEAARPDPEDSRRVTATGIALVIDAPDGGRSSITAPEGLIDSGAQSLTLSGGVQIENSLGYRLSTGPLWAAMNRTEVLAEGPVQAQAPYGHLSAGGMELRSTPGDAAAHVLVFIGRVKLIYEPKAAPVSGQAPKSGDIP